MVYINKIRVDRGISIGDESKGLSLFARTKKVEVMNTGNIYEKMAKRAVTIKQNISYQVYDKKTGEYRTVIPTMLFSSGHGEQIKVTSMNKEGVGTIIESKTGKADENLYLRE